MALEFAPVLHCIIRAYQAKAVCIPQGPAREQFVTAFKEEMKGKMGDQYFEVSHAEVFPEYKVVTNFATEATFIVRCEDRTILCNHRDDSRKYMNYNNSAVTKARVVNAIFNGFIAPGKKTHTAHLIPNKKQSIFILDLAYMDGTQNRAEAHREPKRKKRAIRDEIQANPREDILVRLGDDAAIVERLSEECGSDVEMLVALESVRVCNRGYVLRPNGRKVEGRKLNRCLYVLIRDRKEVPVHKLVALAFLLDDIKRVEQEMGRRFKLLGSTPIQVYHKDGNRMNNHVDNLEFLSKSEATRRGRGRKRDRSML